MDFEVLISEVEKQPAKWDLRDISIRTGNLSKSAFTQAKACTQEQVFNVNAAQGMFGDVVCHSSV